jgi:hypothetical protein
LIPGSCRGSNTGSALAGLKPGVLAVEDVDPLAALHHLGAGLGLERT